MPPRRAGTLQTMFSFIREVEEIRKAGGWFFEYGFQRDLGNATMFQPIFLRAYRIVSLSRHMGYVVYGNKCPYRIGRIDYMKPSRNHTIRGG